MSEASAPRTSQVLSTLIRVTLLRLARGRALVVGSLIGVLPVVAALVFDRGEDLVEAVAALELFVVILLPTMLVAASLGEEIEERTTTYLWSRPIARWTIVIGKVAALAPVALVLALAGWTGAILIGTGEPPDARSLVGLGAGTLAVSAIAAGLATLVPRHGTALTVVYLVVFDLALGLIPASIQHLSVTWQVRLLAGLFDDGGSRGALQPATTLAVIAGVWLALSLWRIRRLES